METNTGKVTMGSLLVLRQWNLFIAFALNKCLNEKWN